MQLKVILVEPEYSENIGYIARAMKNFGFKDLLLVNPKANINSPGAISRAMHALDVLKASKICNSLEEALQDADYSAATTAISCKDKKIERNAITPKTLAERFSISDKRLAVVFGRESRGLTNEEISKCDFVVNIPSSPEYRALTISHAAAIIFYEFFIAKRKKTNKTFETADANTKNTLIKIFERLSLNLSRVRNKEVTVKSFKHLISRAPITRREANAIIAVLGELEKELQRRKG
ncbi:MAG: RNA methyltransferase [Candidatus Diapherotrites archaeon]